MKLIDSAWSLNCILQNHSALLADFTYNAQDAISSLYRRLHLPLLLLFPVAGFLAPYHYFMSSFPWRHVLIPIFLIHALLFAAAVYDRIVEYAKPKATVNPRLDLQSSSRPSMSNIAFYFHLPLCAVSAFFVLHPSLGYTMLGIAELYSLHYSIEYTCKVHRISRTRAITYGFMTLTFFLFPLPIFFLLFNLI